jgi:hypothetical protein
MGKEEKVAGSRKKKIILTNAILHFQRNAETELAPGGVYVQTNLVSCILRTPLEYGRYCRV